MLWHGAHCTAWDSIIIDISDSPICNLVDQRDIWFIVEQVDIYKIEKPENGCGKRESGTTFHLF